MAVFRRVDEGGTVHGVCRGPGPLNTQHYLAYLRSEGYQQGSHGWFSVLAACAGNLLFNKTL